MWKNSLQKILIKFRNLELKGENLTINDLKKQISTLKEKMIMNLKIMIQKVGYESSKIV